MLVLVVHFSKLEKGILAEDLVVFAVVHFAQHLAALVEVNWLRHD